MMVEPRTRVTTWVGAQREAIAPSPTANPWPACSRRWGVSGCAANGPWAEGGAKTLVLSEQPWDRGSMVTGRKAYGSYDDRRRALSLAMGAFFRRHHLDRAPLLLQLCADAVLRRGRSGGAQHRDPKTRAAGPVVVPLGRHVHVPCRVRHLSH